MCGAGNVLLEYGAFLERESLFGARICLLANLQATWHNVDGVALPFADFELTWSVVSNLRPTHRVPQGRGRGQSNERNPTKREMSFARGQGPVNDGFVVGLQAVLNDPYCPRASRVTG